MEDIPSNPRVYRFGVFRLDSRTGEIANNGTDPTPRTAFQLLLALLEQPSELVTRENWSAGSGPRAPLSISIAALTKQSSACAKPSVILRRIPSSSRPFPAKATASLLRSPMSLQEILRLCPRPAASGLSSRLWIGASSCSPPWELQLAQISAGFATGCPTGRAPPHSKSLPLPSFLSRTSPRDPEQEYFADGMTDELITDLAKTRQRPYDFPDFGDALQGNEEMRPGHWPRARRRRRCRRHRHPLR